jgi:hypothetical protein
MQGTHLPRTGLPHRLTLLLIQLIGIALVVLGFHALIHGDVFLGKPFGLALVLIGLNHVRHPAVRHRGMEALALKLLDRWRAPPAP